MVTARFLCTKTPFSKSNAEALPVTSALPPVNKAADRPWKSATVVCIVAFHGVVPLHGTNVEKKPLSGVPPCDCFNCPEIVTKAGCVQDTKPEMVAAPVVGSTDPNWVTLGAMESGGGAGTRLKVRFGDETGKNENDETIKK